MKPKDRLQAWFDNPDTPPEAWKEWTFEAIAKAANVSTSTVLNYLAKMVKIRHPEVESYAIFRQVRKTTAQALYKKGERLPDADIKKIQELRKTHTIHEVVEITGFCAATIQRYSNKKYPTLV
ncbi:MAG: hypothetical protein OXI24_12250 [Candidatus Poribacteria bacterium]|nr:hypothetical protein [Candidatus Poribacteria bacterium]